MIIQKVVADARHMEWKSVVVQVLKAGVSGIPYFHTQYNILDNSQVPLHHAQ